MKYLFLLFGVIATSVASPILSANFTVENDDMFAGMDIIGDGTDRGGVVMFSAPRFDTTANATADIIYLNTDFGEPVIESTNWFSNAAAGASTGAGLAGDCESDGEGAVLCVAGIGSIGQVLIRSSLFGDIQEPSAQDFGDNVALSRCGSAYVDLAVSADDGVYVYRHVIGDHIETFSPLFNVSAPESASSTFGSALRLDHVGSCEPVFFAGDMDGFDGNGTLYFGDASGLKGHFEIPGSKSFGSSIAVFHDVFDTVNVLVTQHSGSITHLTFDEDLIPNMQSELSSESSVTVTDIAVCSSPDGAVHYVAVGTEEPSLIRYNAGARFSGAEVVTVKVDAAIKPSIGFLPHVTFHSQVCTLIVAQPTVNRVYAYSMACSDSPELLAGSGVGEGVGFCHKGSLVPVCPDGYFAGDDGLCLHCTAGHYCEHNLMLNCPAGTYSKLGAAGPEACLACPAGSYSNAVASVSCTLCAPGTYSNSTGADQCQPCALGTFARAAGALECDKCLPGTFANVTGSSECASCLEAGESMYQPEFGKSKCIACDTVVSITRDSCSDKPKPTECKDTQYRDKNLQCAECAALTSNLYCKASSGGNAVTHCATSNHIVRDRTGCDPCPDGYKCDGTEHTTALKRTHSSTPLIVVGGLVLTALLVVIVFLCRRNHDVADEYEPLM